MTEHSKAMVLANFTQVINEDAKEGDKAKNFLAKLPFDVFHSLLNEDGLNVKAEMAVVMAIDNYLKFRENIMPLL